MKSLRSLKARLQRAGDSVDDRPLCKRCRCAKCTRLRTETSGEKRARVAELMAIARSRLVAADPNYPVRELKEQIEQPDFPALLARAGYTLTPLPGFRRADDSEESGAS